MITTIVMAQANSKGGVTHPGESEEPIVVVKRTAVDLHGDMWRGENRAQMQSRPALGKKVTAEAKG